MSAGGYLIRLDHQVFEPKGPAGGSFTLGQAWRELIGVANCGIIRDLDGVEIMRRGMGHTEFLYRDGVWRTRWAWNSERSLFCQHDSWFRCARIFPEVRTLTLPHSEVCVHMGVAGKVMEAARLRRGHMVQLFRADGGLFSAPITVGESGWGRHGFDHTITTFDSEGRWLPKEVSAA